MEILMNANSAKLLAALSLIAKALGDRGYAMTAIPQDLLVVVHEGADGWLCDEAWSQLARFTATVRAIEINTNYADLVAAFKTTYDCLTELSQEMYREEMRMRACKKIEN